MTGRNSVFVDLSSLNVVFKMDTKFVLALNYGNSLERLGEVLSSLGAGYDIYLCLKPRAEGEGDIVLDELSMVGLPFTADTEELYKVLTFFRNSTGVGDIYLCNWLHNYIAMSRVATFKSVFYYGDRVAYISVKDRILERFSLYRDQLEFTEIEGEDYSGYGDLGLIDVDGLRAQYPELKDGSKVQLTAIAPLVQAYKSPLKMQVEDLYEHLEAKFKSGVEIPANEPKAPVKPRPVPDDPQTKPASKEIPAAPDIPQKKEEKVEPAKVRQKTPVLAKLLVFLCALFSFALGVTTHEYLRPQSVFVSEEYFTKADARISALQEMVQVYTKAYGNMKDASVAYDDVHASGLAVQVLSFQYSPDGYLVRCACTSPELIDSFESYIGEKYVVASSNDLGTAMSGEQITYQFSLLFS